MTSFMIREFWLSASEAVGACVTAPTLTVAWSGFVVTDPEPVTVNVFFSGSLPVSGFATALAGPRKAAA